MVNYNHKSISISMGVLSDVLILCMCFYVYVCFTLIIVVWVWGRCSAVTEGKSYYFSLYTCNHIPFSSVAFSSNPFSYLHHLLSPACIIHLPFIHSSLSLHTFHPPHFSPYLAFTFTCCVILLLITQVSGGQHAQGKSFSILIFLFR